MAGNSWLLAVTVASATTLKDGWGNRCCTHVVHRIPPVSELRDGGVGGNPLDPTQGGGDGVITTRWDWDKNGRLSSVTDDNSNTTTYTYDELNRRTAEVFPDGTQKTYTYDRDSNVIQSTDAVGSVVTHLRDGANRLFFRFVQPGPGVEGSTVQGFLYDGLGRQFYAYDQNDPADPEDDSLVHYEYDSLQNVVLEDLLVFIRSRNQHF